MGAPAKGASNFMKYVKDIIFCISGGTIGFTGYCIYEGNEKFYREYVMPAFRLFDAETAHKLAVKAAKYKLVPRPKKPDPPILKSQVFGMEFSNPVGLAAGFDKDGEAVDGLLKMGFGFVEVGSVTPAAQTGNPKPRVFRLTEDNAVINRYGFNSEGHDAVYQRLKVREIEPPVVDYLKLPHMQDERNRANVNFWSINTPLWASEDRIRKVPGIMGVNLGKNKFTSFPVDDYIKGIRMFGRVANYLVINVSSPNTPGLRDMQGKKTLDHLLELVVAERDELKVKTKPPILVKIAPDLTEQDKKDIADVVMKREGFIDGLLISNTTVSRPESLKSPNKSETGGLSGEPLKQLATDTISDMYRLTKGKLPIIGIGGISCGQDAYDKIKAGASLIQLYTALIYQGPPVIARIKRELEELLQKDGYSSVSEAIGANHKHK